MKLTFEQSPEGGKGAVTRISDRRALLKDGTASAKAPELYSCTSRSMLVHSRVTRSLGLEPEGVRPGMRPERSRSQTCHPPYKCRVTASVPTLGEMGAH